MGREVYDAGTHTEGPDIFVHNLKNSKQGFAVMVINPKDEDISINIPKSAEQYLLTADGENLQTKTVKLNGEILKLKSDDTLPVIKGEKLEAGEIKLPSHSIMFLTFKNN